MPTQTPLTDAINALTTYANTVTSASDTTLSDAVATLAAGYGGGGGTTLSLTNIFPSNTSLVTGYLNSNDSIGSQNATNKEVTTDYIDISSYVGKDIYAFCQTVNSKSWVAWRFYTSSKATIGSRGAAEIGSAGVTGAGVEALTSVKCLLATTVVSVPNNAQYVRFSWRTFGDSKLCAVEKDTLDPADYFINRTVSTITFVNAIVSNGTAT